MKQRILKVAENIRIAQSVYRMTLEHPELEEQRPGQFINIRTEGLFLRRPISVYDSEAGWVTIIYKVVGKGTEQLSRLRKGAEADALTGLGNGYDLSKAGERPLLLGGGVGVPPLYMLARKLREDGKEGRVPGTGLRGDRHHSRRQLRDERVGDRRSAGNIQLLLHLRTGADAEGGLPEDGHFRAVQL